MNKKAAERLADDYSQKRDTYKKFVDKLCSVAESILETEGIRYLSVDGRAKTAESFKQKILTSERDIKNIEDVQDLAGVRIITYVYSDVKKIEEEIEKNFHSKEVEKVEERLGIDKMGYRSHHWIISLPSNRLELPEYREFKGLVAELQISTILQHAWAQVEHDQIYKPSSILPDQIKRSFGLLSGLLEVADNEFERISDQIQIYSNSVGEQAEKGQLHIPIDSISLRRYFDDKLKGSKILPVFGPTDGLAEKVIEEFRLMKVTELEQLENLIPKNFWRDVQDYRTEENNYAGVARDIMLIIDAGNYFSVAWQNGWDGMNKREMEFLEKYGVDEKVISKHVSIYPKL